MTGIEPAYSAWEADVLPLNYIGNVACGRLASGVASFIRIVSGRGAATLVACCSPIATSEPKSPPAGWAIDPFDDTLVQPSSVDVRLDSLFRVFNNTRYTHIDPAQQQDELTSLVEPADGEPFVLHPGEFVLGSTLELCTLPEDLAGRLEGKSSLGRLGLLTHSTAGFIDPGFSGHITLELSNVANLPITLWPGMKIGQLCILRLTSPAEHPYGSARAGSKYQGQRGPTPSRSYQNFIRSS